MKSRFITTFTLGLTIVTFSCLSDEDIKLPYENYIPEDISDGWELSTPTDEGFDVNKFENVYEDFFSEDLYPTAHSLLVIRHGKLVSEAYTRDVDERNQYHHLQSATKSITSILAGIAIDKGLIESEHVPIYDIIPEYFDNDVQKRTITLYHLLTMQTGLQFDNDVNTLELFNSSGSSLKYVLKRKLEFLPGTSFYYHDGNPQLVSGVIKEVSGMTEEEFAVKYLFDPLDIENYQWEKHSDGLTFGAFGLWLKPRDMAKIGLMLEQDGIWNDERILSSEWIEVASQVHANSDYGYYFWIRPKNGFAAEGHGFQLIYVNQDQDLVIVVTSDPYSASNVLSPGYWNVVDDVLDAIIK